MKKIELLSSGKAKSLYTTENSDQLIMGIEMTLLLLMEKKSKNLLAKGL